MPTDIKLGDNNIRIIGPVVVEGGLALKIRPVVAGGATSLDLEATIRELMSENEALQGRLDHYDAVRNWNIQGGWRACRKCGVLAHEGGGGRCPVDGRAHDTSGSANYHIPHTRTRHAGQPGWRWCDKCQGLFHGPSGGGRCPTGGAHNLQAPSAAYFVVPEAASRDFGGQNGWRYCQGCHGLFFGGGGVGSVCPAGGAHNGAVSGDYVLDDR